MATLILYKNSKIIPTENYIVDSIEDYLNSLTKETILNFQYIKHAFALSIKLNKSQSTLNFFDDSNNINYVSIQNTNDTYPSYYFVIKKTWISEETISLILQMDTINTFTTERNSFVISPRTLIHRQHKNRFGYRVSPQTGRRIYFRQIDEINEGINPKKILKEKEKISNEIDEDCYLIYKNSKDDSEATDNVVNCFLCFSKPHTIRTILNAYVLEISDFGNNDSLRLRNTSGNTNGRIEFFDEYTKTNISLLVSDIVSFTGSQLFQKRGDYIYMYYQSTLHGQAYLFKYAKFNMSHDFTLNSSQDIFYTTRYLPTMTTQLYAFSEVNKTSSKIIKIIKLPYIPTYGFYTDEDIIIYNYEIWNFSNDENMLQLISLNTEFLSDIAQTQAVNKAFDLTGLLPASFSYTDNKVNERESKLFHSDFYTIKFYYDSFSKELKNEYLDPEETSNCYISFKPSRTINSRFIFKINPSAMYKYPDEDYPEILSVERNNDEVIYNSPYINYIRSGFNYDVKSKNRQEAFSWFTTALGLTAGITSLAVGSKTIGAGLIASSVLSIANSINTTIQAENNLNSKMEQLRWQTNSVNNSDAVDLMSYYCNNRLYSAIYEPTSHMKKVLYDLFFYVGYMKEEQGTPDFYSRIWFNFVSCDLIFDEIVNIPDECLEDLISRFKGGITNMHMNEINSIKTWDWNRQYENWESIFFI